MNVRFEKWSAAALVLAGGGSLADAAAAAGVGERQLRRWRRQPAFKSLVRQTHDDLTHQALGRLLSNLTAASDALVALLADVNPFVRLRAATSVLELAGKLRDSADMAARLDEVKARLDEVEGRP
jgi:transposase-like protein